MSTALVIASAMVSGCAVKGPSTSSPLNPIGPAESISVVSGNSQSGTVAAALGANLVVEVRDDSGNPVVGSSVTFSPAAGSVSPTTAVTDSNGRAETTWTLGTLAGSQSVTVGHTGAAYTGSPATVTFSATAAPEVAASLAYSVSPSSTGVASTNLAVAPTVEARDAYANRATSFASAVTLAAFTDAACTAAAGGTLSAAVNPLAATAGLSAFTNVSYSTNGTIYLKATAAGVTSACSPSIVVAANTPTQLAFTAIPSLPVSADTVWSVQPAVELLDGGGNRVTTATDSVTLAAYTDAGCTAAATGTLVATSNPLAATAGLATFAGVRFTRSGTIYLKATSGALTSACSGSIVVTAGSATALAFSTAPSATAVAATAFAVQPAVAISDSEGNIVTSASNSITLAAFTDAACTAAASGTFGATTNPLAATAGVSTFAGSNYTKAETIYLKATAAGLTAACSSAVAVSAGAAAALTFSVSPSATATAGAAFAVQPSVSVFDAQSNLVTTATNSITLAAFTDAACTAAASGTFGATTNPLAATAGVAAFAGANYTKAETIYLKATSASLTSACSSAIAVAPGAATLLVYDVQPSATGNISVALATQPTVELRDANGNRATTTSLAITLAAYTDVACTSAAGGTLGATTNPLTSTAGLSAFAGVNYSADGTIYLGASGAGVTSACSSAIVIAAATKLGFGTQPSASGTAGTALAVSPVVEVQDSLGNVVASATNSVTLAAYTDASCTVAALGSFGATTNPLAAVAGNASFSGITYTKAETIYIGASAAGLTSACSSAIAVSAGAAATLAFNVQPSASGTAGTDLAVQPVVEIQDAYGNLRTAGSSSVTLAAFTDSGCTAAGTGTFSATTNPVASAAGYATFAGVDYTKAETIYLGATSAGLTAACSTSVAIVAGTATKILIATAPSTLNRPTIAIATSPAFEVTDAYNNRSLVSSASVTLAAFTDSGCSVAAAGTLGATTNPVTATSGLATFAGVQYSRGEKIYVRGASAGLTSACSAEITFGIDLEVPIEVMDFGIASRTSTTTWDRSRTTVTPSLYDGTVTYTFEAVCQNTNVTNAYAVRLVDSAGTVGPSLSFPAATTAPTRLSVTFTPGTPVNYRVSTVATSVAGDLTCYAARVRIRQTYATKTQLYIPLTTGDYNSNDSDTSINGGILGSVTGTTAGQGTTDHYGIWRKDSTVVSGLASGTPWTIEGVLSSTGGGSGIVGLYNGATLVTGATASGTSALPALFSTSFSDGATNFTDATDFQAKIRGSTAGTTVNLYKAALYATLSNIVKTESYFRVGGNTISGATLLVVNQRSLVDTSYFTNPTVLFETSAYKSGGGSPAATLYTGGSNDSGATAAAVGSSTIALTNTKTRASVGALSITNGDRFMLHVTASPGTVKVNQAVIKIQAR